MLLAATDMAVLLLTVELLPVITDLVIVYFLIVMVRLIVVWVGIWSFLRSACDGWCAFVDRPRCHISLRLSRERFG